MSKFIFVKLKKSEIKLYFLGHWEAEKVGEMIDFYQKQKKFKKIKVKLEGVS